MEGLSIEFLQVFVTTPTKDTAEYISKKLLEKKLAGCIQIVGPVISQYLWKGKIEVSDEWLCLIKSTKKQFKKIVQEITQLHTYETPEIIAFPIEYGSSNYLEWLTRELKGSNK
jgi:periplasmic divalent cation tolerance protein